MNNLIQKELEEANGRFVFKEHNGVKALCHDNVVFVETMILHNSRYANIYAENSETKTEIKKLKKKLTIESLKSIIGDINKQNSTHASEEEINKLANRIKSYDKNKGLLLEFLRNPDKEYSLIAKLSKEIKDKNRNRSNFSLATKICQTLCFVLNEGNKYQDNFMKFDSVLKEKLPDYLRAYKVNVDQIIEEDDNYKPDKGSNKEEKFLNWLHKEQKYSIYMRMIKELLKASGNKISKNGLDHLIWYTNK